MELREINLHGKTVEEAIDSVNGCLNGLLKHDQNGVVFIHGKGIHSGKRAKLRQIVRNMIVERGDLEKAGYAVIRGEDTYAIADKYDEGSIIVVKREYTENSSSEGVKQLEKTYIVKTEDGKNLRRNAKRIAHSGKRRRHKHIKVLYDRPNSKLPLIKDDCTENDVSNALYYSSLEINIKSKSKTDLSKTASTHTKRRLRDAARIVNVGINSLIQCLWENGFPVESNPNLLLSSEQYDILVMAFGRENITE
ncbi:MAG: Smr/MutS family protein [Bacteroidales bacterium]|nr:Smr/MutS family protein [Bacteroidales bacterium]